MSAGQQKPLELQSPTGQPLLPVLSPLTGSLLEETQATASRPATRPAQAKRATRPSRPWPREADERSAMGIGRSGTCCSGIGYPRRKVYARRRWADAGLK